MFFKEVLPVEQIQAVGENETQAGVSISGRVGALVLVQVGDATLNGKANALDHFWPE